MSRRKRLLTVGLLAVFAGAALLAVAVWPRAGVTRFTIKKITFGMTEQEVEAVLGGPGVAEHEWITNESKRPTLGPRQLLPAGCRRKAWAGPDFGIVMGFDQHGIVSKDAGGIGRYICRAPSWWEQALDRLGIVSWP
jgi:hypothetical protein